MSFQQVHDFQDSEALPMLHSCFSLSLATSSVMLNLKLKLQPLDTFPPVLNICLIVLVKFL